jgi:hypothetical protein
MKLDIHNLLLDLESFKPETLTSIVDFVHSHKDYTKILFLVKNSNKSARIFLGICLNLIAYDILSDVRLAGLLVIVADVDSDLYVELVSSISNGVGNYHWSRAMAASYLIHKEVLSETIRKSA